VRGREGEKSKRIVRHHQLEVYRVAFEVAMEIYELSKNFPTEERYSLTDQVRRSSRSVCANIAEAWRKRRYEAAFIAKLSDAEAEAAETQTWIQFAVKCKYVEQAPARDLYQKLELVISKLVRMISTPKNWLLSPSPTRPLTPSGKK
jgi:four helix bundle protein